MHKPATPLPWKYGELSQNVIGPKGQLVDECVEADFDDATYIVHAANNYPLLIEALHRIATATLDSKQQQYISQALLRELGEL